MMPFQSKRVRDRRSGTSMVEVLVAASMLLVVMTFVSTAIHRIDLVWRDTAQQRTALNELSNHLEYLTLLTPRELPAAIDSLTPSAMVDQSLPSAELTGELIQDELGSRIVLSLQWKRKHPANPVELSGWVTQVDAANPEEASTADASPATDTNPEPEIEP